MASEQLKQTLLDLHARLAAGEHLDPELQGLLQLLETDIREHLQRGSRPLGQTVTGDAAAYVAPIPGSPTVLPASTRTHTHLDADTETDTGSTVEALTDPATNGLSSRAQEISARFAAEHPHLEPVLRELTDTLQRIGI